MFVMTMTKRRLIRAITFILVLITGIAIGVFALGFLKPVLEQGFASGDGEGHNPFFIEDVYASFPFFDAQFLSFGVGRIGGFPWARTELAPMVASVCQLEYGCFWEGFRPEITHQWGH